MWPSRLAKAPWACAALLPAVIHALAVGSSASGSPVWLAVHPGSQALDASRRLATMGGSTGSLFFAPGTFKDNEQREMMNEVALACPCCFEGIEAG